MDIIASIIVPVYKAEETIVRCLDSLINQTVDNYEVIVVDDGSPDRCGEICDSYAGEKVRVIHQANGGVSKARNAALDASRGKFILFCDSDDYVERNFVETLCRYSENESSDLVCCCFNSINLVMNNVMEKTSGSDEPYILDKREFLKLRKFDLMACGWDKAYKASIIKDNNIRFDESTSFGEDTSFTLEYLTYVEKDIIVIPDRLYNYSYHNEDNLASKYKSDSFFGKYRILFSKYQKTFDVVDIADDENKKNFYTDYFQTFIKCLQNTWDKRNEFSFFKKLIYNHKIVTSEEYKKCYDNMDKSRFVKIYLTVMKSRCALLILAFLKLTK